jgi:hypothetical protein
VQLDLVWVASSIDITKSTGFFGYALANCYRDKLEPLCLIKL